MNIYWLNDDTRTFLSRGYLAEGQTAEHRIREIAEAAESYLGLSGFAEKWIDYMARGWISLASPIWSNFGVNRGLPISCNGSYIPDTTAGILYKAAEIGMMTKFGAGTSFYIGDVRPRGSKISTGGTSNGPVHFMEHLESVTNVISQSKVRRGNAAAYMDVENPDIMEMLECREEGHPIQDLSLGVCVGDDWMRSMIEGDTDKRKVWLRILKKRSETGYPYIFWKDTVNNAAPQVYKDKGIKILASNLCTEICQAATEDESFVCCLLSLNDLHYDEWKDTDLVYMASYFLDAVIEEYIQKTVDIPFMEAAHKFAKRWRAIGIGRLGWHSYLQSKGIPFESYEARKMNIEIQTKHDKDSLAASQDMARSYGEPEGLKGYGERFLTRLAIAPTTSSSFILNAVSPSTEPLDSNYFTKDLAKGKFTYKNPYLINLLEKLGKNDAEIWRSILLKGGSVQHLDFLSDKEKAVFKTFGEIDQAVIIDQAADRQKYLDQSQSLNLKIHPDMPLKEVNALYQRAWKKGVKTLYYQRSTNPSQEYVRGLFSCAACEA